MSVSSTLPPPTRPRLRSPTVKRQRAGRTLVSIIVPAFNESGNLHVLHRATVEAMASRAERWELIFVDDGSSDDTWSVIELLSGRDDRVAGLKLSRNFGHQSALVAGLAHARGSAVITMDADLQHPPQLIPALIDAWHAGSRIVKTRRIDPDGMPRMKRLTSRWFYRLFSYMSGVRLQSGMADYRLFDRRVVKEILALREADLFLRGVVEWIGYSQTTIRYTGGRRHSGQTKYTWWKMIRFAWSGISAFSVVPLRIGVCVGLLASGLAFLATLYAIVGKYSSDGAVSGWASTLAITSFLFGVLFIYLGILGEYLGRVLVEVRRRPRYLVSEAIGKNSESVSPSESTCPDG